MFATPEVAAQVPAEPRDGMASEYPFSTPVDPARLLTPPDLMRAQRDHFEGTPYSTAVGPAAGPYGDPNRYDIWSNGNMTVMDALEGEFPRTISLFRTSYSFVAQVRPRRPTSY